MLEPLFGNKTVQKILIFLFVNGKCYGTQLHRALQTPLTPIQKALARLEKGGIIHSYFEGKTRVYQFNPAYPLLPELEQLLKKTYTLLPAHQKKDYYVVKEETRVRTVGNRHKVLLSFWEKLATVKQLRFQATSRLKEGQGWNGKGNGEVSVVKEGHTALVFHEKGSWQGKQGEVGFSNVFRWKLDRNANLISLEHLRRGADQPVFIFHLAPSGNHSLSSVDSHLCEGDTYFGSIHLDPHTLRLSWRVIGPKKNEELEYYYS